MVYEHRSSIAVSPSDFELALKGIKRCTIRRGVTTVAHRQLTLVCQNNWAEIDVVRVEADLRFRDLTQAHAQAEGFQNIDDLRNDVRRYYPNLGDDERVTAIWFNVSRLRGARQVAMSQSDFGFPFDSTCESSHEQDLPCRGLLIRDPYISDILNGRKCWELRSFPTRIRGRLGLIKSTSGRVFGECILKECLGPLDLDTLLQSTEIGPHDLEEIRNSGATPYLDREGRSSTYAWVLDNVQAYAQPVPYRHPSGAVTFVDLERAISR